MTAALDLITVPANFIAIANRWGGVDVRVRPEYALRTDVDFVRVTEDDGTYLVIHMTHNEVIRGEARLSNSLTGLLSAMVREIVECF